MAAISGIGIGGAFTDAFLGDDNGSITTAKIPSTPPNFAEGLPNAVGELGRLRGLPVENSLADVDCLCHGTIAALNALATGNVAKAGLLTTKGNRDSIYIMKIGGRYSGVGSEEIQGVSAARQPAPLIPKQMTKEVTERIDYQGSVLVELDEEEARSAIRDLLDDGVDAIGCTCTCQTPGSWVYNIGRGERVTSSGFAAAVHAVFPSASIEVKPGLGYLGIGPVHCVMDISLARRDPGYEPGFDLMSGVEDYAESLAALGIQPEVQTPQSKW